MASPTLTTYGRYKSMQDDFANFLGQTGRLCKAPSHLLQEPENSQKKDTPPQPTPDDKPTGGQGRLKGKARKLAREKENSEANTKFESVKTYKLYVKNYIPLAQHVADSKSVHSIIPTWIITTLTSIIRDREEILNHYKGTDATTQEFSGAEQLQCDNEKHEHMISVLRRVHTILRAKHQDDEKRQAAKGAKVPSQRSKALTSETVNKFPQHLNTDEDEPKEDDSVDVAELDKQREADATAWKTAAGAKTSVQYEADIDVSFTDAVQGLKDLCEEWQNMRTQVKQAWRGYADGSVDLGAAAIMANTAIDLARHLEEGVRPVIARNDGICRKSAWKDLLHLLPDPDGPAKNIYFGLYQCLLTGALWDFNVANATAPNPKSINLHRREKADIAECLDFWFISSFQFLKSMHQLTRSAAQLQSETARNGFVYQRIYGVGVEDSQIGSQDFAELSFLGSHTLDFQISFVDEVSRAICVIRDEPDFRLWTVFAWQLFRDAEEVFNLQNPSQAFDELQDYLKAGNGLISDIMDAAAQEVHPPEFFGGVDVLLKGVLVGISSLRVDWVETIGIPHSMVPRAPWNKHPQPFRLLRRHPIFCGLALQSIRLWMHAVGSKLANDGTQAVMTMAHLYNLCHVDAKMKKRGSEWDDWTSAGTWADMERLVISSQPHRVFIGGQAPKIQSECAKNFGLVIGIPMKCLNNCLGSQSGPGTTSVKNTVEDLMSGLKLKRGRKMISFLGDSDLYPVTEKFANRVAEHDDRRDFTVKDLCRILEHDQEKKDAVRPKRRTTIATHQQQPSKLLEDLLNKLNQEAVIFRSSSPRLFMDCVELIQIIDDKLKPYIDVDGILESQGISGRKATRNNKQLTALRIYVVLSGYSEFLPIIRGVLVKWLKSNGGNGAVSFPKPPSRKES